MACWKLKLFKGWKQVCSLLLINPKYCAQLTDNLTQIEKAVSV